MTAPFRLYFSSYVVHWDVLSFYEMWGLVSSGFPAWTLQRTCGVSVGVLPSSGSSPGQSRLWRCEVQHLAGVFQDRS